MLAVAVLAAVRSSNSSSAKLERRDEGTSNMEVLMFLADLPTGHEPESRIAGFPTGGPADWKVGFTDRRFLERTGGFVFIGLSFQLKARG